jgi:hypothetical protein
MEPAASYVCRAGNSRYHLLIKLHKKNPPKGGFFLLCGERGIPRLPMFVGQGTLDTIY